MVLILSNYRFYLDLALLGYPTHLRDNRTLFVYPQGLSKLEINTWDSSSVGIASHLS
jgi:hypothetical protein